MIDPQLLPAANYPPGPPSMFLQTALNPASNYAPIAPAPSHEMEAMQQHASVPRNPFTGPGNSRGSPVLPPLRPLRKDKAPAVEAPPPHYAPSEPQEFEPAPSMAHINNPYYHHIAPGQHHPYHQAYSVHDPSPTGQHPMQQHSQFPGPSMVHPPPPPSHMAGYPGASPTLQGPPPLGGMPLQLTGHPPGSQSGPPSAHSAGSPTGPPLLAPSPPAQGQRHRGSVSSNGNSAGKYRKIAAAPVNPGRPWAAGTGNELRLAHYDHREAIKDYRAHEPPPRTGPTQIRGWNVNNVSKSRNRGGVKKEESDEKDSPK